MRNADLISIELLESKIHNIRLERDDLKKRQAALRVRESRLKKLLNDINQLELPLDDTDDAES